MVVAGAENTVKIIWTRAWFGLAHEAGRLGVVVVYPSHAANGRLGGWVRGLILKVELRVSRSK